MKVLAVAADLLREASSRKWIVGLFASIALLLLGTALSLRLEVVDGALAASRLFGSTLFRDIAAVDVALRPLLKGATYLVFYGGTAFGILACSDFGPSLFSPGRIEYMLALPLSRWQLLLGTLLGVMALALAAALFGAGGLTLILGFKVGLWTWGLLLAALSACIAFVAIYSAMLTAALFIRSGSFGAAVGGFVYVAGIIAGNRGVLAALFEPGWVRSFFRGATLLIPQLSSLADAAAELSAKPGAPTLSNVAVRAATFLAFGAFAYAFGVWRFERKDF